MAIGITKPNLQEEKLTKENEKTLLEERYLPESEGLLGSKTTSMTAEGSIQKDIKIPFCDSCGRILRDEKTSICSCRRKICSSCAIIHENKAYCRECANQITALKKEDFFVLYGLANDASVKDVKHASCMGSDALEEALDTLLEREMIEIKGISVFARYSVTNKGLEALATCEQIYRNEGDVSRFLLKIQELLKEGEE